MKSLFSANLLVILVTLLTSTSTLAALTVEKFKIEGLTSAASPETLTTALESDLKVKVVGLDLKGSPSGWPVLSVEFDSAQLSREDIVEKIATIEDPAGHKYKVNPGTPASNFVYTDEEIKAMALLGPGAPDIEAIVNPIKSSSESLGRGKNSFEANCATCHGLSGNGSGPAALGISIFPRQLWAWYNTDSSTDGYLFWFVTNGRNDMPPWGLVLSEEERWDIINYIKTLKQPE